LPLSCRWRALAGRRRPTKPTILSCDPVRICRWTVKCPVAALADDRAAGVGIARTLQRRHDWLGNAFRHANVSTEVRQFVADLPSRIGHSFGTIVGAAGTVFGRVFDVFTIGILCIYFMMSLPRLPTTIARLVSRDRRAQVDLLLRS
jgi:hypothetical protein